MTRKTAAVLGTPGCAVSGSEERAEPVGEAPSQLSAPCEQAMLSEAGQSLLLVPDLPASATPSLLPSGPAAPVQLH